MATYETIARDCAFTTLALATMGTDRAWDARLAAYLRWQALTDADCDFGVLARACEANDLEQMRIEAAHGRNWRSIPKARAACAPTADAAMAAESVWTAAYCEPCWQAARDLAMTPAPTLAAALFKVQVIQRDELDNDSKMPRDPMAIVIEDMARLAGES